MSDVRLFHTADGGEIECKVGLITIADGLETAGYLSLFGGNEDDAGIAADDPLQWWANFEERVASRRQRSKLQHVLQGLPCTPFNLARVEDAAKADLAWMSEALQATVAVEASIPALNTVNVHIEITIGNQTYPFDFKVNWGTE